MIYLLNHSNSPIAVFDTCAQVWEIFASSFEQPDWIGCADTIAEARAIAQAWCDED